MLRSEWDTRNFIVLAWHCFSFESCRCQTTGLISRGCRRYLYKNKGIFLSYSLHCIIQYDGLHFSNSPTAVSISHLPEIIRQIPEKQRRAAGCGGEQCFLADRAGQRNKGKQRCCCEQGCGGLGMCWVLYRLIIQSWGCCSFLPRPEDWRDACLLL